MTNVKQRDGNPKWNKRNARNKKKPSEGFLHRLDTAGRCILCYLGVSCNMSVSYFKILQTKQMKQIWENLDNGCPLYFYLKN